MAVARNEPCPCGSGRKYKACCAGKGRGRGQWTGLLIALVLLGGVLLAGVALFGSNDAPRGEGAPGQVWSEEHGHWH